MPGSSAAPGPPGRRAQAVGFWRERFPVDVHVVRGFFAERVPGHLRRWWWALGGTVAYLLVLQMVTGVLLTFYYIPESEHAYNSVALITDRVQFGWYIRSLHYWGSHFLVAALVLHLLRVFITGSYRAPRELNWVIGTLLLGTMLGMGFTGYSLVYEQLSYWGATVASNLVEAVPVVGKVLGNFMRGGPLIGPNTLTRFYIFHIALLPTILVGLVALHVWQIHVHGVARLEEEKEKESTKGTFPLFPDHVLTELIIGLVLMIVLTVLALLMPAGLAAPADPYLTPEHIRPEWYFLFTYRWLKLMGRTPAVASMGLFGLAVVLWPWVDGAIRARRPNSEVSVVVGALAFLGIIGLTMWEVVAGT